MNENLEKTLVFLATYNEALNIEKICNLILRLPINLDLLVVDDNSPDGTAVILRQIQEVDARLIIVIRSGKLGLGSAHKEAFTYASCLKYKYLVTLDADLSHNPADIPKLLEAIKGKDFIMKVLGGFYQSKQIN
jgi:dolichol-phosphate mannosyltransferase